MAIYVSSGQVSSGITLNDESMHVDSGGTAISTTVNNSRYLTVDSDGAAESTTVNSGGHLWVYEGGFANSALLNPYGGLFVSSGGTVTGIIENGGYVESAIGADLSYIANSFSGLVLNSKTATVHSGTTAANTTIDSRGILLVYSSGSAVNTTLRDYSSMYVENGGIANHTEINKYSSMYVSGGSVNHTAVNSGYMSVSNGGMINNTILNASGSMFLHSGTADFTTINSGGMLSAFSGGKVNFTTVNEGGAFHVNQAVVCSTTVNSEGYMAVSDQSKVTGSLTLADGATVLFDSGATLDFDISGQSAMDPALVNNHSLISGSPHYTITISADQASGAYTLAGGADGFTGTLSIGTDGSNYGAITVDGGILTCGDYSYWLTSSDNELQLVVADPSALFVTEPGGGVYINDGSVYDYAAALTRLRLANGMVNHADVYGEMEIFGHGNAYNTVVHSGSYLSVGYSSDIVGNQGTVDGITVKSGGRLDFCNGEDNTLRYGETVSVSITNVTVEAGGSINGFKFDRDVVFDDAVNDVVISDVTIDEEYYSTTVVKGWTVSNITVGFHGSLDVRKGGIATDITVQAGGTINGFSFGDETVVIADASNLSNVTVDSYANVYAGQTVSCITVKSEGWLSGELYVYEGGSATDITVESGGGLRIYEGGTAANITVESGGSLDFGEGGTAANIMVNAGGSINGFSIAHAVQIDDFSTFVLSNATVKEYNSAYVYAGQTVTDITVKSDGGLHVREGGTAANITVESGGSLDFGEGGTAANIMVNAGGSINGFSIAHAVQIDDFSTFVLSNATVKEYNSAYVDAGQTVTDITVESGGWLSVYDGGNATNITVQAGGTINGFSFGVETIVIADASNLSNVTVGNGRYYAYVYAGQTVKNVTVGPDNSLYVYEGGKVTGSLEIASGEYGYVRIHGIVDFDISGTMAPAPALVNDLSLIEGTPSYTITVSADQAEGVYTLAGGADGFSEIVTICVEGGGSDSITVGETVTLGGRDYALNLDSSLLTLTVNGGAPVVSGTAGDLNMDGRADIVMTIDQGGHPADGSTGAWLIQENQTAAWGDLSTRTSGWEIFGTGRTVAGKNTDDVYIRSEGNIVGAWTTGDDGKVTGWETVGEFSAETRIVGLGDFNGNGQSDLLLRNNNGAVGCFFTCEEKHGWNYFQSIGDEWKLNAVGDLNGDGRDDVVLKHDAGFAGCWLTQEDGTMAWADLDTLPDGFEIVGAGDFNGDGTDDVLLKSGSYYGAWLVNNGNAAGWMGLGDLGDVTVEQIADFNGDGVDDLRIRTAAGDIGAQLVMAEDTLDWHYYGAVGAEWKTGLAALG